MPFWRWPLALAAFYFEPQAALFHLLTGYGVGLVAAEAEDSVNYDILKKRGAINAPRLKKYDISNGFIL